MMFICDPTTHIQVPLAMPEADVLRLATEHGRRDNPHALIDVIGEDVKCPEGLRGFRVIVYAEVELS